MRKLNSYSNVILCHKWIWISVSIVLYLYPCNNRHVLDFCFYTLSCHCDVTLLCSPVPCWSLISLPKSNSVVCNITMSNFLTMKYYYALHKYCNCFYRFEFLCILHNSNVKYIYIYLLMDVSDTLDDFFFFSAKTYFLPPA